MQIGSRGLVSCYKLLDLYVDVFTFLSGGVVYLQYPRPQFLKERFELTEIDLAIAVHVELSDKSLPF